MVAWFMVVCGFSARAHRAAIKTTFLCINSSAPCSTHPEVPRSSTWKVGTLKGLGDGGREGLWRENIYSGARPSSTATMFGFLLLFWGLWVGIMAGIL